MQIAAATPTASTTTTSSASGSLQQSIQQAVSALNDTSGQYSDSDKLSAYKTITANWQAVGSLDAATQKSVNDTFNSSPFVQHVQSVQNAFIQDQSARASSATTGAGAFQGELDAYNALSASDKALVEPVLNGQTGDQWVALTTARQGLAAIVDQGVAAGTFAKGASQSSDPKVNAALELGSEIGNGTSLSAAQLNAWTQQANAFLGTKSQTAAVNLTLSSAAKALVSASPGPNATRAQATSYDLGEIVDQTV